MHIEVLCVNGFKLLWHILCHKIHVDKSTNRSYWQLSADVCQYLVPLLLGTVRAFGRDTDPLVFPHLFPCESDSLSAVPLTSPTDKKQNKIKLDQTINIPSHFFSEVLLMNLFPFWKYMCLLGLYYDVLYFCSIYMI